MIRKLVSVVAISFALSVAFLAKPAAALPLCDCEFCSFSPNSWCWDDVYGFRYHCYEYTAFNCF